MTSFYYINISIWKVGGVAQLVRAHGSYPWSQEFKSLPRYQPSNTPMKELSRTEIIQLLSLNKKEDLDALFKRAYEIKKEHVGTKVYFRGLIEFSNICSKNCYYCGLRSGNKGLNRYELSEQEVMEAVDLAWKSKYGSIVLQSGEISTAEFADKVERLLKKIKKATNDEIGITLSCGEQPKEVYKRWFDAGAHRYLLRIETSNQDLYYKIHPKDEGHVFEDRIECLSSLKEIGYQVGSGIMVGLPFQSIESIADDLIFLRDLDVDMIGLGPYVEHSSTPLYEQRHSLIPKKERFNMALKCIAILRIMMKDINLASATALQAIDDEGREKALMAGANIIMPNLTPQKYRGDYLLYEDKPCTNEGAVQCKGCLEKRVSKYGESIGYGEWGDSKHFKKRKK